MAVTRLGIIALKKLAKKFGKKEAKKSAKGKAVKAPEESLTTGKLTKEELNDLNSNLKYHVESKTKKLPALKARALDKMMLKNPTTLYGRGRKRWSQSRRRVRREKARADRKRKKKNNKKENEFEPTGFII